VVGLTDDQCVLNGTYRENLVVDRQVTLRGDGTPVIAGGGSSDPLITINATGVVLDGFVLPGCNAEECDSGAVLVLSDASQILNNSISGSSSHGICVLNSKNHLIKGNLIYDNFKAGIRLAGANHSHVEATQVYGNGYGIFIEGSQHNWVSNSDIWGNGADGVTIASSFGNELTGNSIHNNSESGVNLLDGSNNVFVANRIRDCGGSGIDIYRSNSNMVTMNTIDRCDVMGVNIDSGNNNMIVRNSISGNELDGIGILTSKSNSVMENVIKNNRESGISVRDKSRENLITYNAISGNKRYGIVFDDSNLNFVQGNTIKENADGIIMRNCRDNTLIENELDQNSFGISLEFVQNVIVSTNKITNSTRDAIRLLRCDDSKIYSNRILDAGSDGVHIIRSTGTVVSGNDIERSGEYGIQVLDKSDQNLLMLNLVRDSGLGGIYIFEGTFNLVMSNALIDNYKFSGRDNGGNRWLSNYYSDFECVEMIGAVVCAVPFEIYGHRGAVSLDEKPFMNYRVLLGREV
jgi:parallel beta-helix repeat protein